MPSIALYEPKMPANTGNIIRLAANCGFNLHLIEPLGFNFEDKQLRRAGLDYHDLANVKIHSNFSAFLNTVKGNRILALTTKGNSFYHELKYHKDDILLFGSETSGLPAQILDSLPESLKLRLPMQPDSRSLNLSNTVAVVCYESWKQLSFQGGA
ncbi:tRNA (cytidine(34)-2'-O)-methyltransferase [Ghiorsea bivora]|uniref:tRNA (cytidine(34)-2'-O)-methyltransferase n=1 Tax=Ghiorsea bivora TaxID=1485545 RepID=UPI00056EACDF|nr:tRNA (cytidine(34)-2'-O)-methyltransferase [Ghiorsea bivora]